MHLENSDVLSRDLSRDNVIPIAPGSRGILSVGEDASLLSYREQVLRATGAFVRSARPEEARQMIDKFTFSLAIFCHTLPRESAVRLACSVHRHSPTTRLLLLIGNRPRGFEGMLFDDAVEIIEGPDVFLKCVRRLLNRR